jgi:hypothetical protein
VKENLHGVSSSRGMDKSEPPWMYRSKNSLLEQFAAISEFRRTVALDAVNNPDNPVEARGESSAAEEKNPTKNDTHFLFIGFSSLKPPPQK